MYINNSRSIGLYCIKLFKKSSSSFLNIILISILIGCASQKVLDETPELTQAGKSIKNDVPESTSLLDEKEQRQYQQALALLKNKKTEESIAILTPLNKSRRNNFGLNINLAVAYFYTNDFENASKYARQALTINNANAQAHNILGLIYVQQKKFSAAEKSYLKSISLNKDYANAHYNLALLYDIYYQDIGKAYKGYLKYLKLNPNDKKTRDWAEELKYSLKGNS